MTSGIDDGGVFGSLLEVSVGRDTYRGKDSDDDDDYQEFDDGEAVFFNISILHTSIVPPDVGVKRNVLDDDISKSK